MGEKGREIYSTFEFENELLKYNLETVIEELNNYSQPRKNLTFLTQNDVFCQQKDHQRFDDYVTVQ